MHDHFLEEHQLPELLRTPLEELSLQIKALRLGKIEAFLSKALQVRMLFPYRLRFEIENAARVFRDIDSCPGCSSPLILEPCTTQWSFYQPSVRHLHASGTRK